MIKKSNKINYEFLYVQMIKTFKIDYDFLYLLKHLLNIHVSRLPFKYAYTITSSQKNKNFMNLKHDLVQVPCVTIPCKC